MSSTLIARERAAEMLGVSADASRELARRTFLQRLDRVDFVPPAAWCAGLSGLDEAAQAGGFRCATATEMPPEIAALRADLSTFSDDFWKLPPDERRIRFEELSRRSEDDPLTQRQLEHLRHGLDFRTRDFFEFEGMEARLAALISETFPLGAIQRADGRNALLAQIRDSRALRAAGRSLRRANPRLADLDPDLFKRLDNLPTGDERPAPVRRYEPAPAPKSSGNGWVVYLVIFVVIAVIRIGASNSSSSRTSSTYTPPPSVNYPSYNPNYQPIYPQSNSPRWENDDRKRLDEWRKRIEENRIPKNMNDPFANPSRPKDRFPNPLSKDRP
jgi:hypothetical protein